MITFYSGSGSQEIDLLGEAFPLDQWERLKTVAVQLLERRGRLAAAQLLREHAFVLHHGTNGFGDNFEFLYMRAPMARYVDLAELSTQPEARSNFRMIAEAIGEVGRPVRFIAVDLDSSGETSPVAAPTLTVSSDIVERALRDAEQLIATRGATSGVDRVHTAFHGYLHGLLDAAGLAYTPGASITELFKLLREQHPSLRQAGARQADVDKVMRAFASLVDALNTVRNQASVAHPNSALLGEPEAMLVINGVRSLLHYLNAKTR